MGIKEDLAIVAQEERDKKVNELKSARDDTISKLDQQIAVATHDGDRAALESLLSSSTKESWEAHGLSAGQRQLLYELLDMNRKSTLEEVLEAFEVFDDEIKRHLSKVREAGKGIVVVRSNEDGTLQSLQWRPTVDPPKGRDEIYTTDDLNVAKYLVFNPTALTLFALPRELSGVLLINSAEVIDYIESITDEGEKYRTIFAIQPSLIGKYMEEHFADAIERYKNSLEEVVRHCLKSDDRFLEKLDDIRYNIIKTIDVEREDRDRITQSVEHIIENAISELSRYLVPLYSVIPSDKVMEILRVDLTAATVAIISNVQENLSIAYSSLMSTKENAEN